MCGAVGIGASMAPAGGGSILLGAPLLNGCQGEALVVPGS